MISKKITKISEGNKQTVYDIEVEDAHHYILSDGTLSHNSVGGYIPTQILSGGGGAIYSASIILMLSKAQLKEKDDEAEEAGVSKTGIIVTSKPFKNRFAKPIPIKFHISFFKGMNPYVGLENYTTWENSGIGRGKMIEEILEKPMFEADGVTPRLFKGKPRIEKTKTGNFIYEEDKDAKTFAVKHLGKTVKGSSIFSKEVFTEEILKKLDETVIRPLFELPKGVLEEDELNDVLGIDDDSSEDFEQTEN